MNLNAVQITEHNNNIRSEYARALSNADLIIEQLIPPCKLCEYDGVFRCEECTENHFEGFNIKDYPCAL